MASRSAKKATYKSMKKTPGQDHLYNAQGSPEAAEEMEDTAAMKKGGRAKKHMKSGGHAHGGKAKHRADKPMRGHHKHGGHVSHEHHGHAGHHHSGKVQNKEMHSGHHKRKEGGRTPYTSGHVTSEPSESGKTMRGHESERPSGA